MGGCRDSSQNSGPGGKNIAALSSAYPNTTTTSSSGHFNPRFLMRRPSAAEDRTICDETAKEPSSLSDISTMLQGMKTDSEEQGTASMSSEEPDPEAVAALMASEMRSLSIEERTAAYEDVHGVAASVHSETPEAIAQWIKEFHEILRRNRNKAEYEKAVFLNPDYVTDPKNILMFLRAEDYDVRRAVLRIAKHYKHKLELFGIDKLAKPINFDDLSKDDQAAVSTAFFQTLALPDQSGRPILLTFPHRLEFKASINQVRALWYLLMSAVQGDDAAQLNGVVTISYSAGVKDEYVNALPRGRFIELGLATPFLTEAIPYKVQAIHFCLESTLLRPIVAIMQIAIGSKIRLRARTHYGSHTECKYALMTFGIPVSLIPLDDAGQMNMSGFLQMMDGLRRIEGPRVAQEKELETQGRILFPCSGDVLLGRGRPYQDFPGNIMLADLVGEHRPGYKSKNKRDKPAYADYILRIIKKDHNGRFLKKKDAQKGGDKAIMSSLSGTCGGDGAQQEQGGDERFYWVEVDDDVARDKVGHSFRTATPKRRDSLNTSTSSRAAMPLLSSGTEEEDDVSTRLSLEDNNNEYCHGVAGFEQEQIMSIGFQQDEEEHPHGRWPSSSGRREEMTRSSPSGNSRTSSSSSSSAPPSNKRAKTSSTTTL